jgi:hypothetical protein
MGYHRISLFTLRLPLHPRLPHFAADIWSCRFRTSYLCRCSPSSFARPCTCRHRGIAQLVPRRVSPSQQPACASRYRRFGFRLHEGTDSAPEHSGSRAVSQVYELGVSGRQWSGADCHCSPKSKAPDGGRLRLVVLHDLFSVLAVGNRRKSTVYQWRGPAILRR